jgi:mRNA interferase RelE/StbE
MNEFQVVLTPEAQTDIKRLDPALQTRVLNRLEWIGQHVTLLRHQAMQGEEWNGCFKYRIGDYRLIYHIDYPAEKLVILKVGHRREICK